MKKIFLDLGRQPITNSFLKKLDKKSIDNEFFYNLKITFDTNTKLVSLLNFVKPEKMFNKKYAHRASSSLTMMNHFKKISLKLKKKFKRIRCLEIGSNDGAFIRNFTKKSVVAVEPCKNLANITNQLGYKTYPKFWNFELSEKIKNKHGKMNIIFSSNTISHVPYLDEILRGIENILKNDGLFVFEDPYIYSVLKNNSYDQFYDEHAHLFSLLAMMNIVKPYNLKIVDVERLDTHGGSIRFYISKSSSKYKVHKNVKKILRLEIKNKLNQFKTYQLFATRVKKSKIKLQRILKKIKSSNTEIVGYGATYKSATVYNYCGINKKKISYIIDTTKNKQNKFTPGSHIEIKSPQKGFNDKLNIKFAFLGAWNFKKEILKKEMKYIKNGGSFITHVPEPRIINLKNVNREIR